MKKDFIDLAKYDKVTLSAIVERAIELKKGASPIKMAKKSLAMIFTKPSTRTNVSFQRAIQRLGGEAIYLGSDAMQLSRGESIGDTARTLSRYVDAIMIRTYAHSDVIELARSASVPVINGLTDLLHPCQALGDVMSLRESFSEDYENMKLAYIGDGNNVCNSLINAAGVFGFHFSAALPEGYEPDEQILKNMQQKNLNIQVLTDPAEAVRGADAIYTDVWVSMGDDREAEKRKEIFRAYQVNPELLNHAKPSTIVLHCLPAHRGEEITDEVIDGPQSYIFDQAENRMHIQQSILEYLLLQ